MRWPSSLRARLALWHSLLVGLPLAAFAIVSYLVFSQALIGSADRFISEALSAFTRELGAERRAGLGTAQAMLTTVREVRFRELHIMIVDPTGRVVALTNPGDSTRWAAPPPAVVDPLDRQVMTQFPDARVLDQPVHATLTSAGGPFRVRVQRLDADGVSYVLSGRYPLRDAQQTMGEIRRTYALAIPLLILAAAVSGYFLARRSLAPVTSITDRAAAIGATTLHERVPVGGGDELVRLATVVNELLDRLEASFDQQRRFMADASHELRTPTAIVRTEADVTLSKPHREEQDYRASVAVMQNASRRLTRIVDDLFLLARSDAGHLVVHREAIHLEDVVDDVARGMRPVAEHRGVQLQVTEVAEAPMRGDADLLGRLLLNLLDNAIKHSPTSGIVRVCMTRGADTVAVAVSDEGPGIPPEARERVFERFFRVDIARTRQETSHTSGAGLGLAIARRIAEAHGGRLELLGSGPGQTTFRVTLPITSS